jgi:PAS domain-containing protein
MGIAAYAVLAPGAGFLAGFVLAAVFRGALPSWRAARRRPSWEKTGDMPDHPRFWQMLLSQGGQAVAVLDGAGEALFLCGRAAHYLAACRNTIEPALASLTRDGIGFQCELTLCGTERIAVTGRPVGRRAVVYFAPQARDAAADAELSRMLDGFATLVRALPVPIAAFGGDRRLWAFSDAYARLWGLDRDTLARRPTEEDILDQLRQAGRLPEQADFQGWKQRQLGLGVGTRDVWHLPGGRSLRVVRQVAANRKLLVFEDVSGQLAQETEISLLGRVQQAIIDTLDEGVALLGPDGRLLAGNARFAAQWRMTKSDLLRHPHYTQIAAAQAERMGPDGIWATVGHGVNAMEAAALPPPCTLLRADGRSFLLTLSRLPDGTTMASFLDFADLERFEVLQAQDRNAAAPGAARGGRQG